MHRKRYVRALAVASISGACVLLLAPSPRGSLAHAEPRTEPGEAPVDAWPSPEHTDQDEDDEEATTPPSPVLPPSSRANVVVRDGMVHVPGARFTMGSSDESAPANERPARSVNVGSFWIDRTEVTVGDYRTCVDRGACPRPPKTSLSCTYDAGDPRLPVSCVPWSSADAYCAFAHKRLPREVEWELAARGTTGAIYPWGGTRTSCRLAITLVREHSQRSCAGRAPKRVGSSPLGASPFGALDMSGNVEEWVADWYAERASDVSPRAGASHVLRGGGFLSPPSRARTTSRNWGSMREAGPNVGFRCAKDDRRMR